MPDIIFEGHTYPCKPDETVLDCMTRHGVSMASSCRSGACQTCMVRAIDGTPPQTAQKGLKDTLKVQGYFLACVCKPEENMEIMLADMADQTHQAQLISKTWMNESIVRLRLMPEEPLRYEPGQFINLLRAEDGLARSYSLASLPDEAYLELHIKRIPDGAMSSWVCDILKEGDEITFSDPVGHCFYVQGTPEQAMLMVGAGTGLAPLYGIVRHALESGHQGDIHLIHGSLATAGLYMIDELRALDEKWPNFHYTPCVLHGDAPLGGIQGNLEGVALKVAHSAGDLSGQRVFLCGDPQLVEEMQKACFLAGVARQDIHADAFSFAS